MEKLTENQEFQREQFEEERWLGEYYKEMIEEEQSMVGDYISYEEIEYGME